MTPEERRLVVQLFDRLTTLEDAARDPEAERLITDSLRQAPNAAYALVQTVLVQDEALRRADARLRELENQGGTKAQDTSFLGNMRDSLFGRGETRSSVPTVRPGATAGMSPAWRDTGPARMDQPTATTNPSAAPAPMPMGGSFLGTAASAAAGVIGGALLLDGIRSMMGHHGGAHAAFDPQGVSPSSPWSGSSSGELSRQAGIDDIGRSAPSSTDFGSSGLLDANADDQPSMNDLDDSGFDDADIDSSDTGDGGVDVDDGN